MTFWVAPGIGLTNWLMLCVRKTAFCHKNLCYQWVKTISNSCKQFVHQQGTVRKTPTGFEEKRETSVDKRTLCDKGCSGKKRRELKSSHPQCEYLNDDEKQSTDTPCPLMTAITRPI